MKANILVFLVFLVCIASVTMGISATEGSGTAGGAIATQKMPRWFRAKLVDSSFCALCEIIESDDPHQKVSFKILELYRGRREEPPPHPMVFFEGASIGHRFLVIKGPDVIASKNGIPVFSYYAQIRIEDEAVYPHVKESATGVDVPRARVTLKEIASLFKGR
jgi:hypothetical protein